LIEFGLLVLDKIFKNFQCIFALLLLSPLGGGLSLLFEQTWIPSTQGWFVPSLVKIGPMGLEKKSKIYKFTDGQTDRRMERQMNAGQRAIRKAHFSFQLRWAKNVTKSPSKKSDLLSWKIFLKINPIHAFTITDNFPRSTNVGDIKATTYYDTTLIKSHSQKSDPL
jgi:hypothetical protein